MCVRGGPRQQWIPLPTTSRGDQLCVTLSSTKSPWVLRALTTGKQGRDSHDAALVLKAFEADIRAELGVAEQAPTTDVTAVTESESPPEKQRLMYSDSETEQDSPCSGESGSSGRSHVKRLAASHPAAGNRRKVVELVGFMSTKLGETEVQIAVSSQQQNHRDSASPLGPVF